MDNPNQDPPRSKRTFRQKNINNINNTTNNKSRHASMSDVGSPADSWHSANRSPFQFDEPQNDHTPNNNDKSLVSPDLSYSSALSHDKLNFPATDPPSTGLRSGRLPWPRSERLDYPASEGNGSRGKKLRLESQDLYAGIAPAARAPAVLGLNGLSSREDEEGSMQVKKVVADGGGGGGGLEEGQMVLRLKRESKAAGVRKAAAVFRVFGMAACLISFSVMAADRTKGWAGDSYDRYIEYRYCLAVNIIGFVYSAFQAMGLGCQMGSSGDDRSWCLHFDFSMDQILAYLLLSSASCAATRVTDWMLNWGKDDFTLMATASIAMSFIAFIAFAVSSVISGYYLFNRDS